AARLASARPTSAASGRTCPPGRSVRSRPSNPTAFADSQARATLRSARLSVKRTNLTALGPSTAPVHGMTSSHVVSRGHDPLSSGWSKTPGRGAGPFLFETDGFGGISGPHDRAVEGAVRAGVPAPPGGG